MARHECEVGIPLLLTAEQAAGLLGVSPKTLRRYADAGLAPAPIKLVPAKTGASRYRRDEIVEWVRNGLPPVKGRVLHASVQGKGGCHGSQV